MSNDRRPEGATNDRPLNDTVASSGSGIPDEALGPGEELAEMPDDEEVERVAKRLGADLKEEGKDSGRG